MKNTLKNTIYSTVAGLGILLGAQNAKAQDAFEVPPGFEQNGRQTEPVQTPTQPADDVPSPQQNIDAPQTRQAAEPADKISLTPFGLYSLEGVDYVRARGGADTDSHFGELSGRFMGRPGDLPLVINASGRAAYGKNGIGEDNSHDFLSTDVRLNLGLRLGSGDKTLPHHGIVVGPSIGHHRIVRDGNVEHKLESYVRLGGQLFIPLGRFQALVDGGVHLDVGSETNIKASGQRLDLETNGYDARLLLSYDAFRGDTWGVAVQLGGSLESRTFELSGMRAGQPATQTTNVFQYGGQGRLIFYHKEGHVISPYAEVLLGRREDEFSFQPSRSDDRTVIRAGLDGQFRLYTSEDKKISLSLEGHAGFLRDTQAEEKNGYEASGGIVLRF